jgi:hypothetical protein
MDFQHTFEELRIQAKELVERIQSLIHEANVRRIIIKDETGHTFMEVPVSVAAVGAVATPLLAALGALAALVARFTIVIERAAQPEPPAPAEAQPPES